MSFDELLKDAWQGETRSAAAPDLTRRVRRQQQRHRVQRATEVALTLMAVLVFGVALVGGGMQPVHWLLMPFFAVFLPSAWAIVLRTPRRRTADVTERVSTHARLRLSQLHAGLRDLWMARLAAWSLLGYAVLANAGVWILAGPQWRSAGLLLLAVAILWTGATGWLRRVLRRRWLREYRAVRRLTEA